MQVVIQFVGLLAGLLTSIISARILGSECRGSFSIFSTSLNFLVVFLGFGLSYSLMYFISEEKISIQKSYNSLLFYVFLLALFFLLLIFIEEFFSFSIFTGLTSFNEKLILMFVVFFNLINSIISGLLFGLKKIQDQQLSTLLFYFFNIFLHFLVFLFSAFVKIDYEVFLFFYCLIMFVSVLINFYYLSKYVNLNFQFHFLEISEIRNLFFFAGLAYFANLFQFFSYKMDNYFLQNFCSLSEIGVYSLGFNLFKMFWLLPIAISSILTPIHTGQNFDVVVDNTVRVSRILFLLALLAILLSGPFLRYLIPLVYGLEFGMSSDILLCFLVGFIPVSISNILLSFFNAKGMVKYNFQYAVFTFMVTLISNYFTVPLFGVFGVVLSNIISMFLGLFVCLWHFQKVSGRRVFELFYPKRSDFAYLIKTMKPGK